VQEKMVFNLETMQHYQLIRW